MEQATHNKSFTCHFCKSEPLRTQAKRSALVTHRQLPEKRPAGRASSIRKIVVTLSRELASRREVGLVAGQA